jgi:DNA-binding transcriptional ArsR family regulator
VACTRSAWLAISRTQYVVRSVRRQPDLRSERREGRQRYYRLNPEPLKEIRNWMRHYEKFWTRKLRDLGVYLDSRHGRA